MKLFARRGPESLILLSDLSRQIPTSVQSWDQANGVMLHRDSLLLLPAFTNLTKILCHSFKTEQRLKFTSGVKLFS